MIQRNPEQHAMTSAKFKVTAIWMAVWMKSIKNRSMLTKHTHTTGTTGQKKISGIRNRKMHYERAVKYPRLSSTRIKSRVSENNKKNMYEMQDEW